MCLRCDGYSWEEIERGTDLAIRVHGFQMLRVEGEPGWTYTIGASESFGQPELVVIDVVPELQVALIDAVVDDYRRAGEVQSFTLQLLDIELGPVHDSHLADGIIGAWERHYGRDATPADIRQIIPGPSWFCDCCAAKVRRLDDAEFTVE